MTPSTSFNYRSRPGVVRDLAFRSEVLSGYEASGLVLQHPERIEIFLNPTAAGHIPVITTGDRSDFEALVRALAMRIEPLDVPAFIHECGMALHGYSSTGQP
jgi:hypothetical protein